MSVRHEKLFPIWDSHICFYIRSKLPFPTFKVDVTRECLLQTHRYSSVPMLCSWDKWFNMVSFFLILFSEMRLIMHFHGIFPLLYKWSFAGKFNGLWKKNQWTFCEIMIPMMLIRSFRIMCFRSTFREEGRK